MKPKILRTYNSVWKVEKVLYGIQDIPLPIPVSYRQGGIFVGGVVLVWILNHFPPLSLIHFNLIEYIAIPGFAAWFFTKQLLDGKAPHRFIWRWVQFHLSSHKFNRYKDISINKKKYRYENKISYRTLKHEKSEGEDNVN